MVFQVEVQIIQQSRVIRAVLWLPGKASNSSLLLCGLHQSTRPPERTASNPMIASWTNPYLNDVDSAARPCNDPPTVMPYGDGYWHLSAQHLSDRMYNTQEEDMLV